MDRLKILFFILTTLGLSSLEVSAAEKVHERVGVISYLSPTSVIIQSGNEQFELKREDHILKQTQDARVGDRVILQYSINAKRILFEKDATSLPGQAAPSELFNGVLDDRAAYPA